MGFRFRKSIQLMPGLKMNISHKGVGYSAGVKGARISRSPSGRVTRTLSVPGTGISHVSTLSSGRGASGAVRRPPGGSVRPPATPSAPWPSPAALLRAAPPPPAPPRPGPLAPAWEEQLFQAVTDLSSDPTQTLPGVARAHGQAQPTVRVLCAALEGLWHFQHAAAGLDHPAAGAKRARELLAWAVAHGALDLGAHPFVRKYLAQRTWPVEIAAGIVVELTLEQDVVGLAAAELHQSAGDLPVAIWTVEQVDPPTTAAALSLAELYSDADRDSDVIDLTNGIGNDDDATALLLVLRGRAFSRTGHHDAGRLALKDALRVRSRAAQVRHRALLERASINLAQNRKAAARKDLETILVEDPQYPGLQDALAALPS